LVGEELSGPTATPCIPWRFFDLDAGPVTITLPDPDKHFMTMQIINEDQYTQPVYYGAGSHTLTREMIGTRYAGCRSSRIGRSRDKE